MESTVPSIQSSPEDALPLADILASLEDVVWSIGEQPARRVYLSPSAETLLGRLVSDVCRDPNLWHSMIHPDDRERVERALDGATGRVEVDYRIVRPDGEARWLRDRRTVVRDADGAVARVDGILTDISEWKRLEAAWHDSEVRYRQLVDQSPDGIVVTDVQGHCIDINQAACDILGYTREELLGLNITQFISPEELAANPVPLDELRAGKTVQRIRRVRRKDGTLFTLEITARLLDDGRLQTIARDVSERERIEQAKREQVALAEAFRETASALNATLDLDQVLDLILTHTERVVPNDAANVMLLRAGVARIVRSRGYAERGLDTFLPNLSFPVARFANLQHMIDSSQPLLVPDVDTYPGWVSVPELGWVRAYLAAPIRIADEVVGFVNLDSATPGAFTAEHRQRLHAYCQQVAVAIQNARLFETTRRQLEELTILHAITTTGAEATSEDALIARSVQLIGAVLYPDSFGVLLADEANTTMRPHRSYHGVSQDVRQLTIAPGEGVAGMVWTTGRPWRIADVRQEPRYREVSPSTRSELCVPIRLGDRIIGVLNAESAQPNAFSEIDEQLLMTIAGQLAVALARQRSEATEREQRALAEALRDTAAVLNSTLDLDQVLDRILTTVGRVVAHEAAAVILVEPDERVRTVRYRGYAERDLRPILLNARVDLQSMRHLQRMATLGKPLAIPDTQHHADWSADPHTHWIRSFAGAPMRARGRVIGFMSMFSTAAGFYNSAHAERLQAFADQAAIALENAQLFEAERVARERVETLQAATQALSATLDLQQVFELILSELRKVVPYDSASVQQIKDARLEIIGGYGFPNLPEILGASFDLNSADNPNREVIRTRAPLIVDDAPNHYAGFLKEPHAAANIRAWLGVPLLFGDQPIGMIALDRRAPHSFNADDVRLAQAFAAQAAIAIENARLFEAERQRRQELELFHQVSLSLTASLELPQVLDAILSAVIRMVPLEDTHIFLYDGERLTFAAAMTPEGRLTRPVVEPRQGGLTYTVARTGQPMVIEDVSRHPLPIGAPADRQGAIIGLPLTLGANVVGVMNVYFRTPRRIAESELSALGLLAAHAAIAIQNAQLYEAARKRLAQQAALLAASTAIASSLDLDTVLNRLAEQIVKATDVTSAYICDWDPESGTSTVRAQYVGPAASADERQSDLGVVYHLAEDFGDDLAEWLLPGKPIVSQVDDPNLVESARAHMLKYGGKSILTIPLVVKGQSVGYADLWESRRRREFTPEEIALCQGIAQQAAIAFENARLYDALRRHADELEERVAVRTGELDSALRRMQAILDSAGEGIYLADVNHRIQYVNPAMEHITGYTADEILGQRPILWRSQQTPRGVIDDLQRAVQRFEPWRGEVINRRKDGTLYDVALTITPLKDADGRPLGFVSVQRDISRLKELDRLKDMFVTNVSHELRTPLANVKLYLSLLEHGKPGKYDAYRQTLGREVARLERLLDIMLDLSRLDLGALPVRPEPVDVNPLVADLVTDRSEVAAERGLELASQLDPGLPRALADPVMLTQAMSHLLENALNYTPRGGALRVETTLRPRGEQHWVTFTVSDTGPGISEEDRAHLFERFYRGQAGRRYGTSGTGLGLALSQEIVERLGGSITVESEPGQGAAFTVWLRPADRTTA